MANTNPPVRGVAFDLYCFIAKTDGTVIANPGGLASRIVKDGDSGNAGPSPSCVDTTGGTVKIALTNTNMTADCITVKITSTDSGAIPFVATIYTSAQTMDTISSAITAIAAIFTGMTSLPKWLRGIFRKDTMDSTAKTEVNDSGGTYNETTDSNEAIRDTAPLGTAMRGTDGAITSLSGIATATNVSDSQTAIISAMPDVSSLALEATAQDIKDQTDQLAFTGGTVNANAEVTVGDVTLATSQPNYAPAKAGDAMTLTGAYDAAKTASSQASVDVIDGIVDDIKTEVLTHPTLSEIEASTIIAKEATLANATYGLSALKTLIDAIDTSTELQARFTEIKGAGWTTETLKSIKDLVSAIDDDPWDTELPGSYDDGTAGAILSGVNGSQISADVVAALQANLIPGDYQSRVTKKGRTLTVFKGDTIAAGDITSTFGAEWNLTGRTVYFCVKASPYDTENMVDLACTITDVVNNTVSVPELDLDALAVPAGELVYEFESRVTADDSKPRTIRQGIFNVNQDVRR